MKLPNWRDASSYPTKDSYQEPECLKDDPLHTSKAWAWQFLRRNKSYQADYLASSSGSGNTGNPEAAAKYGLGFLLPPNFENPEFIPFIGSYHLRELDNVMLASTTLKLKESQFAFVFDIQLPLKNQISQLREQLSEKVTDADPELTMGSHRKRTNVFPRYLRVLDARQAKVTFTEIADQLASENLYIQNLQNGETCTQKAEQDFNRAKILVEHTYIGIAHS